MKQSVVPDRVLSALDESRSTRMGPVLLRDRSAPRRAEPATAPIEAEAHPARSNKVPGQKTGAVTGVVEINARKRGENSVPAELNETLARAYKLLDQNRNYRQISVLLTYRGIQLIEESQLLMKQSLEIQVSMWASCQQTVARSFAMLSYGMKQDSNEPPPDCGAPPDCGGG